jgi:phage-related protein
VWDEKSWINFPFIIEDVVEDGQGGLPSFVIRVSNVSRDLVQLVDEYAGALGATATLRVVHTDHLDGDAVFEEPYKIISANIDLNWVSFTLGAENPLNQRSPRQRYLMDSCRYKLFKGVLCGYVGAETTCDRTLKQCTDYGNDTRFGGFPSVSVGGGFYAA